MKRFKFPIAVAITSLALVVIVGAVAILTTPIGRVAAQGVLGNAPWMGGTDFGPHGFQLPSELQGLVDLPPTERFAHFVGVQVNLKDKDNKPLTIAVTPGTIATASATSLTVAANDGTTKTFNIDSNTVIHGKPGSSASRAAQQSLINGDKVIVITTNGSPTACAAIGVGNGDFGRGGFGPPWAHWGY